MRLMLAGAFSSTEHRSAMREWMHSFCCPVTKDDWVRTPRIRGT